MAHPRRFRFGIQLEHGRLARAEWADLAREAEDLGLLHAVRARPLRRAARARARPSRPPPTPPPRCGSARSSSTTTTSTRSSPAKEMATLDLLSSAGSSSASAPGWMASDYEQSGIPMDDAATRVDRLEEGIAVLKGLFAAGPFSFAGQALPGHRPRRPAEAGAGAPPAVPHRRRRPARAARWPAARPTSSASTPPIRSGRVDAAAAQDGVAELTDRKVGWVQGGGRRPLRRHRDADADVRVRRHRRPRRHARGDGPAVRADPRRAGRLSVRLGRLRRPASPTTCVARRERWDTSYLVVQGADAMRAAAPDRRPPRRHLTPWATRRPTHRPRSGSPAPAG